MEVGFYPLFNLLIDHGVVGTHSFVFGLKVEDSPPKKAVKLAASTMTQVISICQTKNKCTKVPQ